MQGELFNFKTSGPVVDASKLTQAQPNWLDRFRVTLRLEHISMIGITALVLYVVLFSFGVEKGKRMAFHEIEAEKNGERQIAEELAQTRPVQPETVVQTQENGVLPKPAPVLPSRAESKPSSAAFLGKFTIQTITFKSKVRAEQEVKKYQDKGLQSFIVPVGKFFQVCVDSFETVSDAKQKLGELKEQGFAPQDAYIRPLKGQVSL